MDRGNTKRGLRFYRGTESEISKRGHNPDKCFGFGEVFCVSHRITLTDWFLIIIHIGEEHGGGYWSKQLS